MLKSTRPFKDFVTNYPKEPALRIGRQVPKNAVNLAYYYNPTATDAEKVLTAEAPRKTIDHRVEDAYRYLFNQAKDDDSLFPTSVMHEDEDGYKGRLGRMYVQWYPESHVEIKNVQETKDIIVTEKSEVPKMFEYADEAGYKGNLYLDAASYEVTKTRDVTTHEYLDREVSTHELNYHEIFKTYVNPKALDSWMVQPGHDGSFWPKTIVIDEDSCSTDYGNASVVDYVNKTANPYDEACGVLIFDSIEYEQVYKGTAASGKIDEALIGYEFISNKYSSDWDPLDAEANSRTYMKTNYEAVYNASTDKYDYSQIEAWLSMGYARCTNKKASFFEKIEQAIINNKDIVIYMDKNDMVLDDMSSPTSEYAFHAKYKYKISDRGAEGAYEYNVIVNYKGKLVKTIIHEKEVAAEYKATCNYVGLARKVWYDYDGMAYYRGSVTKGNSIGNINPENDNELLMFSDDDGYLRRPIVVTDENGNTSIDNFYDVEADYIYLTDVFKDGKACFYKYPLKKDIYDYRGPDDNGFYEGNAVKICTANFKDTPSGYVHNMKLRVAETEIVDDITDDFQVISKEIPKRYIAELYTSFVSSSTDTFKVTYNAFNDSDEDNVAIDNGTTEDIYNYPFMHRDVDFFMEKQHALTRTNKIKLPVPKVIEDTRNYVSFSYTVTAERKEDGKKFTTSKRTASILNRDFVVPAEYNKFDGRGMIISPETDGILLSPFDMVLYDQAASRVAPVITSQDKDFIFYVTITEISDIHRGAVNIRCNADGSGYITAETTIDTGFYDEKTGAYTKKLCLDSPYWLENGKIYPGFKIKCIDSRHIKVNPPRHDGLLESWYPMIQFGHYSQVLAQYGAYTRAFYSMPEYDEQHYSNVYKAPYVDIADEEVSILNSHMVKTKCYPLFVKDVISETIKLYKVLDDERFEIKIKDVSFSDGIIVTEDTISENDNIICDYTYVEENYVYRGYWRNINDFARIDLNPNMYHTYSDLNYIPSVTKPSKNLFNKVIYFFMRPSLIVEGQEVIDTDVAIDSSDENLLAKMYDESDLLMFTTSSPDVTILTGDQKIEKWANVSGTIQGITNDSCLYMFNTLTAYRYYEHTVTMLSTDADNDCLVVILSAVKNGMGFDTLSIVCRLNAAETHCSLPANVQFALVYNYYQPSQKIIAIDGTFATTGGWRNFKNGMTVKIIKDIDGSIKIYRTQMDGGTGGSFDTTRKKPVITSSLQDIFEYTGTDFIDGAIGYGNVSQSGATFKGINVGIYSENRTTHIEYQYDTPLLKNDDTLYHQIDNSQPESDHDIYLGSVYIRQNTSLHSTVLVDSRVRGGGVLKEMSDSLRRELEPDSDFYLDIGYYDGEPYQENGVIIVRLDNSLLKEFGGRFTHDDVETKVKRWLGFGVYPIIEYVDSYSEKDMPQYNLVVEDSYTNVTDETPQIYLECVDI